MEEVYALPYTQFIHSLTIHPHTPPETRNRTFGELKKDKYVNFLFSSLLAFRGVGCMATTPAYIRIFE